MKKSELEEKFASLWVENSQIELARQIKKVIPGRRFSFDFGHHESRVLIEIQGGIWMRKSGHNTGAGILRDCIKNNLAILNGWVVFMIPSNLINAEYCGIIEETIKSRLHESQSKSDPFS